MPEAQPNVKGLKTIHHLRFNNHFPDKPGLVGCSTGSLFLPVIEEIFVHNCKARLHPVTKLYQALRETKSTENYSQASSLLDWPTGLRNKACCSLKATQKTTHDYCYNYY